MDQTPNIIFLTSEALKIVSLWDKLCYLDVLCEIEFHNVHGLKKSDFL